MDTVKRWFRCGRCGQMQQYAYEASPHCCGEHMIPGEPVFRTEGKGRQLHMIRLMRDPDVDWQLPTKPDMIFELWQLKPSGRADPDSQHLGYLGKRATTWEWVPPRGIGIRPGFAACGEEAAQCLLLAMDGGVVARKVIAEIAK